MPTVRSEWGPVHLSSTLFYTAKCVLYFHPEAVFGAKKVGANQEDNQVCGFYLGANFSLPRARSSGFCKTLAIYGQRSGVYDLRIALGQIYFSTGTMFEQGLAARICLRAFGA